MLDYVNKEYINSHDNIKISIEMNEMWSFYHDKHHQIWLWWAIDHNTGEVIAYWFCTREHKMLDKLMELLNPLEIGKVYIDGNYAYFKHFSSDKLVVTKKNTKKIERKHLSLRTWCARLVRKGIRFSKTEQMHKIVVGLVINYWFFARFHWLNNFRTRPKIHYVRYADGFIITGATKEILENAVLHVVEQFMSERGVVLSKER